MKLHKYKILLNTDGNDGGVEVDPLSQAASGVDTSFPLISPDRILRFKLVKVSVGPTKEHETTTPDAKELATLKFKTEVPTTSTDGKPINPGFPVSHWITLVPMPAKTADKKDFSIDDVKRGIAMFLKAAGRPELPLSSLRDNPTQFEGLVFEMRVGIRKGTGTYPDSNTLAFVLPA